MKKKNHMEDKQDTQYKGRIIDWKDSEGGQVDSEDEKPPGNWTQKNMHTNIKVIKKLKKHYKIL